MSTYDDILAEQRETNKLLRNIRVCVAKLADMEFVDDDGSTTNPRGAAFSRTLQMRNHNVLIDRSVDQSPILPKGTVEMRGENRVRIINLPEE